MHVNVSLQNPAHRAVLATIRHHRREDLLRTADRLVPSTRSLLELLDFDDLEGVIVHFATLEDATLVFPATLDSEASGEARAAEPIAQSANVTRQRTDVAGEQATKAVRTVPASPVPPVSPRSGRKKTMKDAAASEVKDPSATSAVVDRVKRAVAAHWNVPVAQLSATGRSRIVAGPRNDAAYLVHELAGLGEKETARLLGVARHQVAYAVRTIGAAIKSKPEALQRMDSMRAVVNEAASHS